MDAPDGKPPRPPAAPGDAARTGREERLAKALRDNLRRRKGVTKPAPADQGPD